MERRDFFKISAITGAAAALDGCGKPEQQLIRFIPDEDLVPGVATWKPSICTLCPAGCGLTVRVMQGDAEVVRNGKLGLLRMGLAKKLEGNPQHPVNHGKLCARGQAGLQVTYHPDRVRHPLKRSGARGSGEFQEISWDDAVKELVSQLSALGQKNEAGSVAFLARPLRGQRRVLVETFLKTLGAPSPVSYELFDESVLRRANLLSFGQSQLPTLDLARSLYVISFGADFLGTWNSPVAQAIGYGEMRQGHPGQRGRFVQIEPRLSQTGANADEWIPARLGSEGALALSLAHVILNQKLRSPSAGHAASLIPGWAQGLPDYAPEKAEKLTGVPAAKIVELAQEVTSHEPGVAVVGGAALAQTSGLATALAVNALNELLGSVNSPGGIFFTPVPAFAASADPQGLPGRSQGQLAALNAMLQEILLDRPHSPKVLLLHDANPVFATPPDAHVQAALEKVPFIASFGNFVDETSVLADLILPDHSPLESWLDEVPESGTLTATVSVAAPAMLPLHNTRSMPDVLLDVAHQLGGNVSTSLPWKTYDEMLKSAFGELEKNVNAKSGDVWKKAQEDGWWSPSEGNVTGVKPRPVPSAAGRAPLTLTEPQFDGSPDAYPFSFLPFASTMLYDGSLAHLPWMQETPDPLSTVMWGSWVEINTRSAEHLGIRQGDLVEVASQHGKLQAPALLSPGIAPDVVAMPVGQGHENFGRYASHRGANPVSILAPTVEPETGALAWAATRVKISKVGEGKLILFAGGMRENPVEHQPR
ncbi:MAG TPA: molybdopterin-dependent oxidoreductase [Terriglobia bacterium]|nr:molybdopterin-dependent oxidoreductase [Terriglobia bacterium]